MASETPKLVRVGVIGCGEISQVVHLPTLNHLSHLYTVTYLCDISQEALKHCRAKVAGYEAPRTTTDPKELCASPLVDVVLVANADEYHTEHTILALEHGKHVLVEKPMALSMRDADAIIAAERASKARVMVGYMRRYAAVFEDVVREVGGLDKILYARVRDIIGPNSVFVDQSGTFPQKFTDIPEDAILDKSARGNEIVSQAIETEAGIKNSTVNPMMWRALGGLGSHDLSAMREVLGMPTGVVGASLEFPFWSALLKYPTFTVAYESGLDSVPRFDAHIEVYGGDKAVRITYDTPYVKGLPITMRVQENINGSLRETITRKSYEDPYTLELKELYEMVVNGKPVKTTAEDAKKDLEIFRMLFESAQ
ncbi:hypothetical protein P175DRAFT_0534954 [Aspergillus ochraceoroseus IBT 24754]|uniref:Gfo/Idh/MocA-like oxidoreductase N-terminal domain-containing protein n=2 Tax=Aspergillus ochraceoroseus TaxID=138278 RepID=A0A2T5LP39_9EURO|nr:uncharacterized protein P175DRAFT_0534954 [Aspergillus ochraceoroseus IBT 24754]KKK24343.1 hypothetical protein AOCH_005460 [Aspergillus ochraceoroseus]PTU18050.1 hypothetical protein P175DRAFT_0534954 [Aspergillus ochraceoroseus IBT 24754]